MMRFNLNFLNIRIIMFLVLLFVHSCDGSDDKIYTLYRSSVAIKGARFHVATFDADEERNDYNKENCFIAKDLFQVQIGVETTFWCEKGRYRK